jgi:hypothetical protein
LVWVRFAKTAFAAARSVIGFVLPKSPLRRAMLGSGLFCQNSSRSLQKFTSPSRLLSELDRPS